MKKILDRIANLMMHISCAALGACIAVNAYEIFMRFLFAKSLFWIQDFTLLMMLWFIFPGMVKIASKGNDISVDIFVNLFPKCIQRLLAILMDLLVTVFSMLLFYFSVDMFFLRIGQVKIVSQIPLNLYTAAIMVSMLFMSLVYIEKLIRQFKERKA